MLKRVGIIGAGQLGAFLCRAASQLGLETTVLAPDENAPAMTLATESLVAEYDDELAIRRLCERSDVVTFEFENVPDFTLGLLSELVAKDQVAVYPDPSILMMIKNKSSQKSWLSRNGFPTSSFLASDDAEFNFDSIALRIGAPFVQKLKTGGFDGRGVQVVSKASDLWQNPSIAEVFVPFQRELSVIVSRSVAGEVMVYPTVEQCFDPKDNVLQLAFAPANISEELEQTARTMGANIVEALAGIGVFAIELFQISESELLVNEISPRVHNSGHMTMEAHATNQFEQHLRAICGYALGPTTQLSAAASQNILFESAHEVLCNTPNVAWQADTDTWVHWYGKKQGRLGRKMGHITGTAKNVDEAAIRVSKVLASLRKIEELV